MRLITRYFMTAAFAIIALTAYAQEPDLNLCSLHIATEPVGASVKLDNKGPFSTPYLASEIQTGDHLIAVSKEGYITHRETVSLGAGLRVPLLIKLTPITGLLLVHTTPEGVEVNMDEADQGKTPLLLTDIALGKYKLTLSKPGYLPKTLNLNVESRIPKRIDETLTPDSAKLALDSNPQGAKITLNGSSYGVTPRTIDQIPGGTSTVELEYKGYKTYTKTMKLAAGQSAELTAELESIPSSLTVYSRPTNARIYINNQYEGDSPVTLKDLKPGPYRLRAELDGFEPTARTINLERDSHIKEELRMDGNCGDIEITTEPAGIKVFVDGHERGVTSFKKSETDRVSNPLAITMVPAGDHEIKLTNKQYFTQTFKITIEKDETLTLHPKKMRRRFIPNIEIRTRTEVFQGVLLQTTPQGDVKIEVRPGIVKTIPAKDIKVKMPIQAPKAE